MVQNVKHNPPPMAPQTRELVVIQPNIGNLQFSMDSTVQGYISEMQPFISAAYGSDDASDVLSYLVEAFKRRETFLFTHVIQDSEGNDIYLPDWSESTFFPPALVEAPGHRDFIKNSFTVIQDDFATTLPIPLFCSSSYAQSERSMRSCSQSSASDSGSDVEYDALKDPKLTNGTSEEKKDIVREFGENLFEGKLIRKPNLLRASSKNHDRVFKIVGKPRIYTKMLEFFQNRKAFNLNQVINAAVVQGEAGVTFILELNSPEPLKVYTGSYSIQGPWGYNTMNGLSREFSVAMADQLGVDVGLVEFQVNQVGEDVELKWGVRGDHKLANTMQGTSFSTDFQTTLRGNPAISSAIGSSQLRNGKVFLDAELAKNTQHVELDDFKAHGPAYNYSKLAYEISQYIKAIKLFKDGNEILKQTMGEKFGALNLADQTWSGIEDAFENKHASSVAGRYSAEALRSMSDLSRRLSFRFKLIVQKGYDLRQIQAEQKDVFDLSHLHAKIPDFKTCLKFDAKKEKRDRDILDCETEIKKYEDIVGKEKHVAHKRDKLNNLIQEGKNREEKAKEKSKDFMEKNGLSDYKVFYEEDETDESYSAFDEAICDKGMEEIERVYHIIMEVIEKINHDQSVTQSNTEKKKNVSNQSGKRSTKPQKGNSKPRQRKNNRGYAGRKTNKSQSKNKAKRY